jgi:hypothetical protein
MLLMLVQPTGEGDDEKEKWIQSSAHGAGNYHPECRLTLQSFQSDGVFAQYAVFSSAGERFVIASANDRAAADDIALRLGSRGCPGRSKDKENTSQNSNIGEAYSAQFLSNSEKLKKGNANASTSTVLVRFVTCVLLRRFRCCAGTKIESFKSFADCYQDKGSGARDCLLSRHDWLESPHQQQSRFGFGLRRYDFAIGRK